MAFPTLSSPPSVDGYSHAAAFDPVIRSPKEAGYVQTRPSCTHVPKKFHLEYPGDMIDADQTTLAAWEVSMMYGANSDTWTHPKTSVVYTVRLAAPIEYKLGISDAYWSFSLDLEEV